jgi:hypothetical protein
MPSVRQVGERLALFQFFQRPPAREVGRLRMYPGRRPVVKGSPVQIRRGPATVTG